MSIRVGVVIDDVDLLVGYEFYTNKTHISLRVGIGRNPYKRIVVEAFSDMQSLVRDFQELAPYMQRIIDSHDEGRAFYFLSETFLNIDKAKKEAQRPALEEIKNSLKGMGFEVF